MLCLPEMGCVPSMRLRSVISGPMAGIVFRAGGHTRELHLNSTKIGVGQSLRGVVGEKILRPQLVTDFLECLIELRNGGCIKIFAAGVFRELDQRMLAAGVTASACLDGNDNDAVH